MLYKKLNLKISAKLGPFGLRLNADQIDRYQDTDEYLLQFGAKWCTDNYHAISQGQQQSYD